jgi:hypothetical protein
MERVAESWTEACERVLLYPTRIIVEVMVNGRPLWKRKLAARCPGRVISGALRNTKGRHME